MNLFPPSTTTSYRPSWFCFPDRVGTCIKVATSYVFTAKEDWCVQVREGPERGGVACLALCFGGR